MEKMSPAFEAFCILIQTFFNKKEGPGSDRPLWGSLTWVQILSSEGLDDKQLPKVYLAVKESEVYFTLSFCKLN